ncbi:MAG: exosortase/archaeosortase family protein [Deltaproteobacteria bacterium]|nr:exosortase/archaeosortase family protein [Deltaproteobacteria bacterium]MBW2542204.1 exosortase/archaeosortase family protein [Deltaproteobacteria bacterium]
MAGVLVLAFLPALIALIGVWTSVDYYSHGFLVPLVAYWAAARSRTRFAISESRDRRALIAAIAVVLLYATGLATGSVSLQGLALVAAVASCALYLGGSRGLRVLAFPLAFLVFMLPLPPDWLTPLIVELQLMVSAAAVEMLGWFGSAVVRSGNVIQLPAGDTLFVAEACSGITSLVTLTPLAIVLAYFTEKTLARRLTLVLAVVPAAMLGNLLRVIVTVLAAERYGAEAATGNWLHESAGMLTFALACLALIGLGVLMRRLPPARA